MRLTEYEKNVRREVDQWQRADGSLVMQAMNWAMKPVDLLVERISPQILDQVSDSVASFLQMLNDASEWTYDANQTLDAARRRGIVVETLTDLRDRPLEELDPLARSYVTENALMAAVEGGGAGLGGAVFIAADIPLLFTINFRLIQQIAATYGFGLRGPTYRPLVLAVFNVAASDDRDARADALREVSVAAAAFASGLEYRGRVSGTFREQNRHIPREIAKNIVGRKIGQMIPLAGAAVGAGVNYWFTSQTAEAAFMLFRALFVEYKERR
jgi:hypothetical protein